MLILPPHPYYEIACKFFQLLLADRLAKLITALLQLLVGNEPKKYE